MAASTALQKSGQRKRQLLALDGMLYQTGKQTPLCGAPEDLVSLLSAKKEKTAATFHLLARCKNDLGDFDAASRDVAAALKLLGRPRDAGGVRALAAVRCTESVLAENGGDAIRAQELFGMAWRTDEASTRLHCWRRSEACAQARDYGGATRALERLVATSGDVRDSVQLATVELRLGDYDRAERLYREARKRDPACAQAYAGGAEVLKRRVFGHGRSDREPTIAAEDTDARIIAIEECLELLRRDVELVKTGSPVDGDRDVYVARQAKLITFLKGELDKWKFEAQAGAFVCGIMCTFCAGD